MICCLVWWLTGHAQNGGAYYPSAYVYSEKDGVMHNNLAQLSILPSGSLAAYSYSNGHYFLSSNSSSYFSATSSSALLDAKFFVISQDTFFRSGSQGWFHWYKDSTFPIPNSPTSINYEIQLGQYIYFLSEMPGQTIYPRKATLWRFDGVGFQSIYKMDSCFSSLQYCEALGHMVFLEIKQKQLHLYKIDTALAKVRLLANFSSPKIPSLLRYPCILNRDSIIYCFNNKNAYLQTKNSYVAFPEKASMYSGNHLYFARPGKHSSVTIYNANGLQEYILPTEDNKLNSVTDTFYNSLYVGSNNYLYRLFKHIKTYPKVFGNNTNVIMSLQQYANGNLLVGNYNGAVATITPAGAVVQKNWDNPVLPGGLSIGNQAYLIHEGKGQGGITAFNQQGQPLPILSGFSGYYLYQSTITKQVYFGTGNHHGLLIADPNSFIAGKPKWQIVDSSKGLSLANIITITEDAQGRIWCGRNSQGIAIYYPKENKAETFLIEKDDVSFGAMASMSDSYGTVWMGR